VTSNRAYLGLGGNLGEVACTFGRALAHISMLCHTRVVKTSSLYRTTPIDATGPDYLNAVTCVQTALNANDFLIQLQRIEGTQKRERPYRNAPRTLDLDILLFGDALLQTPALEVPHPRLHVRAFVLAPLVEVAPDVIIPRRGLAQSLLSTVADQRIERIEPHYWHATCAATPR
jgi:2-amino-4-hydroxy-6-hydroxymethyldihydropteridine diphosphokinase